MRQLVSSLLVAAVLGLASLTTALAQDWTGRWVTQGAAVTNYLDLKQDGANVVGTVSGYDTGTLTGTATGGAITASLKLGTGVTYTVTGTLAGDTIQLRLVAGPAISDVTLVRDRGQAQQQLPPPAVQYYYLDAANAQVGPIDFAALEAAVTAGSVKPETLVWTAGMAGWERADAVATVAALFATRPLPTDAEYWYQVDQDLKGPFTAQAIIDKGLAGELKPWSQIWISTTQTWDRADGYVELHAGLFPAAPAGPTAATVNLPAFTPNLTADERKKVGMVLGSTLGILFHEFGHAMIGEMEVPVTGPEEDSVDEFSAIMLATAFHPDALAGETPEIFNLMATMVQNSALTWRRAQEDRERTGNAKPWYDAHSDESNRFRNIFCLIYGSSPDTYKPLADYVDFPEAERTQCGFDYPRRLKAWRTITAPFVRDLDGTGEGKAAADAPGGELVLHIRPSLIATGNQLGPVFAESGIFEGITELLEKYFVWPRKLEVVFADCGEVNAFYEPANHRVMMCWEGVEHFAGLLLDADGIPRR